MMPLGQHSLADFYGCPSQNLSDPAIVSRALQDAARAAGAQVLAEHFHHFGEGMGVTGVLLLMESHISIHTWPEHGYAAIDLFLCGEARAKAALEILQRVFAPQQTQLSQLARGKAV